MKPINKILKNTNLDNLSCGIPVRRRYFFPKFRSTTIKEIPKIMFCIRLRFIRRRMRCNLTHFKLMVSLGGMRKFND